MEDKPPLSRSQVFEYVRLDGLQKLTSVSAHDWDLYILKELVDNALDADEAAGLSPSIHVVMSYGGLGLSIQVRNSSAFPLHAVPELFNFTRRSSVKDLYRLPTRGSQGNALKTLLGIPYALQYRFFEDYEPEVKPLTISTRDEAATLWLDIDELNETLSLRFEKEAATPLTLGTSVTVNLFQFIQQKPRTSADLDRVARAYALWNPHASFKFEFVIREALYTFESTGDMTLQRKKEVQSPAPIGWYTFDRFKELQIAYLKYTARQELPDPSLDEMAGLFGMSAYPTGAWPGGATPLGAFLRSGDGSQINKHWRILYDTLQAAPNAVTRQLDKLGEAAMRRLCGGEEDSFFAYRCHESLSGHQPYILEAAFSGRSQGERLILTGINQSPAYYDPFLITRFQLQEDQEPVRGLDQLLDRLEIGATPSVTLAVHLTSPAIEYSNYGKSTVHAEAYREALVALITEIVAGYQQSIKPVDAPDYLTRPAKNI